MKKIYIKLKSILRRINGISCPFGGISWSNDKTHLTTKEQNSSSNNKTIPREYDFEHKKDLEVIDKIFNKITSLKKLDYFMEQALYPYLIHSTLEEFVELERFIASSYYHVYDNELKNLLKKFYIAWGNVCKYWEAFTPTNNSDKLRPDTQMDIAMTEDVQIAINEVPQNAKSMHSELKTLLNYIRNQYKEIEL